MTKIHLSETIADTPDKAGIKPQENSYSFNLAENNSPSIYKIDPESLAVISSSDVDQDLLNFKRKVPIQTLFRSNFKYEIDFNQWQYTVADSSTNDPTIQAIIWTNRNNVRATYPTDRVTVKFSPQESAATIQCLSFPVTGLQQGLLFSKRTFSPGLTTPLFITIDAKMSLALSNDVKKQWGWFNGSFGYFFQIKGSGNDNQFSIVSRSNYGTIVDTEITRSSFNGTQININFSAVNTYGIEIGSGGTSAKFYVFYNNKWILLHSTQDSDKLQNPTVIEIGLPIAIAINNTQPNTTTETITTYAHSVSIQRILQDNTPGAFEITKKITSTPGFTQVLMGIRGSRSIKEIINSNILLLNLINIITTKSCNLFIIKNPENDDTLRWISLGNGMEVNTTRNAPFVRGKNVCTLGVSSTGVSISLKNLFSLQKEFSSVQMTNDIIPNGDNGYQIVLNQDTYWICITCTDIGFFPGIDAIYWDLATGLNVTINNMSSQNASATFSATSTLSFVEV